MRKEFSKLIIRGVLTIILMGILYTLESFVYEEGTNLLVWMFIASAVVRIIELENEVKGKQ